MAGIAREDQLQRFGECTASRPVVEGEGGKDLFCFEIPHLQRMVPRRRDARCPSAVTATA